MDRNMSAEIEKLVEMIAQLTHESSELFCTHLSISFDAEIHSQSRKVAPPVVFLWLWWMVASRSMVIDGFSGSP